MHRPLKFSVWFSIVITAVFVVAWLWIRESSVPGPYDLEPVSIVRNGNGTANDIVGWQTYRNEKYGFEVKYPPDWVIETSPEISNYISGFFVMIMPQEFQNEKRDMSLKIDPFSVGRDSAFTSDASVRIEETTFAGKKAKLYNCPDLNPCPFQLAYSKAIRFTDLSKNWTIDNEINFSVRKDSEYLIPIFNQILSTFKFTSDETAGWKVYNNAKFDFSFQVPANWILIKENEKHPNGIGYITILQSPDYQEKHYESSFRTDITGGVRVVIDLQYPSMIKTMKEMIDFWNLGRGGHIKKSESLIKVGEEEALFHVLGDYPVGGFKDVHIIHDDKWFDILYSYADDKRFDKLFDQILSTFKFLK